jgi:transposase
MPKSRPPYPPEFRAEAIRLARSRGKPPAEIARELGMTGETLRLWLKHSRKPIWMRASATMA